MGQSDSRRCGRCGGRDDGSGECPACGNTLAREVTHDIEGLRITMRCAAGHERTFEVAAFAPLIPVHCPECPWHTPWRQVGEPEDFTMKLPLPSHDGQCVSAPFYESERVRLYCGDCADVIPTLDPAHLLVTDPPYGVDYQSNRRQDRLDKIAGDDGTLDVGRLIDAAARKIARGRHAYIFGPNVLLTDGVLTAQVELVWDKMVTGTGDLTASWSPSHEAITFAVQEISKANRAKGYGNLSARVRKGSVLRHQRAQGAATGRHPNEKPVPLLRELIESSSVIGETVLDPFCGVGSTLVAAVLEGRKAVGVEVSEAYCVVAVERLRAVEAALDGLGKAA